MDIGWYTNKQTLDGHRMVHQLASTLTLKPFHNWSSLVLFWWEMKMLYVVMISRTYKLWTITNPQTLQLPIVNGWATRYPSSSCFDRTSHIGILNMRIGLDNHPFPCFLLLGRDEEASQRSVLRWGCIIIRYFGYLSRRYKVHPVITVFHLHLGAFKNPDKASTVWKQSSRGSFRSHTNYGSGPGNPTYLLWRTGISEASAVCF